MSLCRVDTDRLRGLASQLGTTAVALEDAAPVAALLSQHGYPSSAQRVAGALTGAIRFLTSWDASLHDRAELLDRQSRLFASPTIVTRELLRNAEIGARLATHAGLPWRLPADGPGLRWKAAAAPEATGALGGIPHEVRFVANRMMITETRAAILRALDSNPENPRTLRAQLAVLDELDDGTRNFLLFDWERKRIVEWIGPQNAAHVAVYVPGAAVGAAEYPALAAELDQLVRLERSGELAIVAALAYDTPPTVAHAAFGRYADRGGPELRRLLSGLQIGDRHVTLVAHSYGAVVLGEALRLGLAASLPEDLDVVVLGAPGVRADHVSELGVPGDRFWAALLPGDRIVGARHPSALPKAAACAATGLAEVLRSCPNDERLLHGINPVTPGFGGTTIEPASSDAHGSAHSDYLAVRVVDGHVEPSPMVRELMRILLGRARRGR